MTRVVIRPERPDQDEIIAFLDASDAYAQSLYPPESNHLLDVASLLEPEVQFFVARAADGRALGCGAVVRMADEWGEVKRMWVDPAGRGRGVGRLILATLEATARGAGLTMLRLETGIHNTEALALYRQAGFSEIPAFGNYAPDPLSVFMEKRIG